MLSTPRPPGLGLLALLPKPHHPHHPRLIGLALSTQPCHPGITIPDLIVLGLAVLGLNVPDFSSQSSSSWPRRPGLDVPASLSRPRCPGLVVVVLASPCRPRRPGLVVSASFSRPCHPALILLAWSSQHCCAGPQRRLTPNTYAGSLPPYGPPRPMRPRHKSPNFPTLPPVKPHEDGRCADRLKGPRWHCSWQGRRRIQDNNKQQTL